MRDFALEAYFSRWEFTARYNLAGSDAQSMGLGELLELASAEDREAFESLHLGYTETWGAPALREAVAGTYEAVAAGGILCFAGAEEALYVAGRVLLEPGDHAIVLTPGYQSAETVPLARAEVSGVAIEPTDEGWALDPGRVAAKIRPNTKLLSINFPNNPTGYIPSHEVFEELVALCRRWGIWILGDEVHRLLESDPSRRLPQVADLYERGISLNVMSKAYGLPGLRIGWLAARDEALLTRCERYKHYLSICNSAPSEVLARIALGARERILARTRRVVEENLARLEAFFARRPDSFDWRRPDGSCVAFPRYLGPEGVEEFTRRLVEEAGVVLLPASLFRSELTEVPADRFRIGFGQGYFPRGLAVLEDWLARC